ncbi:arsenical pump-driving ATPase [Bdellovibrionota bacterium FG-1]
MNGFVDAPTRFLFFTGKGGVGKTSLACSTAVTLADRGAKVLLVSTDPASNLDEVLGVRLTAEPIAIPKVPNLFALNIDPEAAAKAYRERSIGPYRGVLPPDSIRDMEEQLSGACTVEVAAFDEFTSLLLNDQVTSKFNHIIFDTAPTGHTLRLLSLPSAWKDFLTTSTHGASCLGPSSALNNQRDRYEQAVNTLRNQKDTTVILVTRPDSVAIAEAERTSHELDGIGLQNQQLAINAVFRATNRSDRVALAFEERANDALKNLPPTLASKERSVFYLKPYNMVGIQALRAFFKDDELETKADLLVAMPTGTLSIGQLVDGIIMDGRCLVMVMGKGGVGKTTIAASIASELASRGHPVHLTTTDPAAHLEATLAGEKRLSSLTVSRIDPKIETQKYIDQVVASSGKGLDKKGLALLKEDLRSPCTEEVAVFRAFSRIVSEARDHFVVLDTAPTGHTLLLLDATGSYHREVMKKFSHGAVSASHVTTPMMRLKDPKYTKLLIVTLPETTPVSEAEALQKDLRRAEIEPYAWVINQCLAGTQTRDPILARRAHHEVEQIRRVQSGLANSVIIIPWT